MGFIKLLLGSAAGLGFATMLKKGHDWIDKHPRAVKVIIIAFLNLLGFVCFWGFFFAVSYRYLLPDKLDNHYVFFYRFFFVVTFILAGILELGLYTLIRALIGVAKTIGEKAKDVGEGIKKTGEAVISAPGKVAGAALKKAGEESKRVTKFSVDKAKAGAEWAREKAPEIRKATADQSKRVFNTTKNAAVETTKGVGGFFSKIAKNIKSKFGKKGEGE